MTQDLEINDLMIIIIILYGQDDKLEGIEKYYRNITGDNYIDIIAIGLKMINTGSTSLDLPENFS